MPPQIPWRLTGLFLLMALLMVVPQLMVVAVGLNFVVWAMVAAIRLSSLMIAWRQPRNPAPAGGVPSKVAIHAPRYTPWLDRLAGSVGGLASGARSPAPGLFEAKETS